MPDVCDCDGSDTTKEKKCSQLLSHAQDAGALPQLGREHPAVKHTKEYLQAHFAQEVALQELAGVVNMSPFHLARIFRQAVGMSPHAYQTQLRLAHAKTLLEQGFDVRYVAMETGFCDQSHFARHFKRNFLATPGSYRKTARFSYNQADLLKGSSHFCHPQSNQPRY